MERIEVPVRGEAEEWVAAVERGDEVVLTRDGKAVAEVKAAGPTQPGTYDPEAIRRLHAEVPPELRGTGLDTIHEIRESYRY